MVAAEVGTSLRRDPERWLNHHQQRHCERSEAVQAGGTELDRLVALLLAMTMRSAKFKKSSVLRLSAPAIGRIAPRRDQKRHVIMRLGFGHREADGNDPEEGRIGKRRALPHKILADRETQFVLRNRDRLIRDQRPVGAAVARW